MLVYLKCGPFSDPFPTRLNGQRAHKRGHALRVELALLVHVHDVNLQELSWGGAPHTEVEPGPEMIRQRSYTV